MLRCIPLIFIFGLLAACAATDTYSPRASTYNTEAEALSNEMLLFNVLRASDRVPLQFTDIQSLTGQTTSTGSIGLSTPVGGFPAATTRTINPMVSGTLQTTFQGVVLNSQEFYQGVSAPISAVQASYFVRSVAPSELIFDLLFSQMVVSRGGPECKGNSYFAQCSISFGNNPRKNFREVLFQEMLHYLLRLGLSMEDIKVFNREISNEVKAPKYENDIKGIFKDVDRRDVARFCFRPRDDYALKNIADKSFICGAIGAVSALDKLQDDEDQKPDIKMGKDIIDRLLFLVNRSNAKCSTDGKAESVKDDRESDIDFDDRPEYLECALRAFKNQNVRVEFRSRSTLGLFDYLGSLVRKSEVLQPVPALIRGVINKGLGPLPCGSVYDEKCSPVFAISLVPNSKALSVKYEGRTYYLSSQQGDIGYSTQTLSILKQILGLNTNSKNVPVPAIITGTLVP